MFILRIKRNELANRVAEKVKIYLDTNYWIYFRDVVLGRPKNDDLMKSYKLIESLCDKGLVVCPISKDVFYEITKRLNVEELSVSIKLIDKLSQGVSLITQEERIKAEILHFL